LTRYKEDWVKTGYKGRLRAGLCPDISRRTRRNMKGAHQEARLNKFIEGYI